MTLFQSLGSPNHHSSQITRYLLVGTVSFFLDAGSIWLTYRMLHLSIGAATTLGFMGGLTFNFIASKTFTFGARSDMPGQTVRYAVLLGANYVVTLIIVSASETWGPGYLIGKLCSAGLIASSNYYALGHWVFVTPRPRRAIRSSRFAKNNMQNIGEG
jgi:putative flippase GtrA